MTRSLVGDGHGLVAEALTVLTRRRGARVVTQGGGTRSQLHAGALAVEHAVGQHVGVTAGPPATAPGA